MHAAGARPSGRALRRGLGDPRALRAAAGRARRRGGRFLAALAPHGLGFIAHAAAESHYLRFYERFLADFRADTPTTPYLSSDDVLAALRAAGARPRVRRIAYSHDVAAADTATVEGYLQRCAFDDAVPLAAMLAAPALGSYLAGCREGARYRFHQEVDLVFLGWDPSNPVVSQA